MSRYSNRHSKPDRAGRKRDAHGIAQPRSKDGRPATLDTLKAKLAALNGAPDHVILEIDEDASAQSVRHAYFKNARRYHPDRFLHWNGSTEVNTQVKEVGGRLFIAVEKAYRRMQKHATSSSVALTTVKMATLAAPPQNLKAEANRRIIRDLANPSEPRLTRRKIYSERKARRSEHPKRPKNAELCTDRPLTSCSSPPDKKAKADRLRESSTHCTAGRTLGAQTPACPEEGEVEQLLARAAHQGEAGKDNECEGLLHRILSLDPDNQEALTRLANIRAARSSLALFHRQTKVR